MVELRHLRYFVEVARQQHVTRAAEALHVTQSTLSHQLRQLEDLLGTALFDRVGRGVQLTEAGETFLSFATRALLEVEGGATALQELGSLARGRLRLGVIHTYNATLLPPVVARFAAAFPGVHLAIEDLPGLTIENGVANGELDLGIAFAGPVRDDVVSEPLFSEELVLAVPTGHPCAGQREIAAAQLAGLRLAAQTGRFSSRRLIDQALGRWIAGAIHLEMSSIEAMLRTVRLGNLAAVLFERAVPSSAELLRLPIRQPTVRRTAALLWHAGRTRSAAAKRLAGEIRAAAAVGQ
ncbi:LysR substrate-binding domain-containing protein [Xylophilus sp.]|uniref:LysR substrate-binding domain-containing protein n=1 Tax=Xylophilus sp. TaxID=2653893 RepID=UPI0013BBBBF2|nr:LysR substrate-binding domain-containing protein [Xylophilus sp.]KAF1046744.1 MAG: HTH-type transcriptional regulator CynR [Xylophilus sp.]